MSAIGAIIGRELRLSLRQGGDLLTLLVLFIGIGVLVPLAVGPDRALLARIAPGIIWIAALLAQLLIHDRLFRADHEDGSLLAFRHAGLPLEAIVGAKLVAHWITGGLPVIIAAPLMGVMLGLEPMTALAAVGVLVIGTPALTALVAISAAITVGLRRGGLVAPVLILPLTLPVLIFGTGALSASAMAAQGQAVLLLGALSLVSVAMAPFAAAAALKISGE
ncbi:heme exporter protein CcmB [Pelagibacterium montanilacus]|uniref:heme exporter protein CcmB n=1 Tax=Pelagibacterium montanilacus TaxID=2185280 RepID=UPI000F8D24B1|nr:heme exporter protein CcmB [Pelagibacterium montanilacus]